jgi:LPXTG-motif cell wall-anchored protein
VKASESVDFWQYTVDLDALYDEEQLGYALTAGSEVTWIESTLGSAYQLTSNTAAAGENVGIIAYDIATHQVQDGGELTVDADVHRECVMFTSAEGDTPVTPPTTPTPPTELPQTGPEHILLALAALLLGFGFLKFRRKA